MNPRDFIKFASKIAARPEAEPADCRSAISRAYYGAYHSVRDLLEDEMNISCSSAGGNEHLLVKRLLSSCNVDEGVELAALLGNLHQSRKEADYDLKKVKAETRGQAMLCVERATEIEALRLKCADSPTKEKIRDGIIQYKKKTNTA